MSYHGGMGALEPAIPSTAAFTSLARAILASPGRSVPYAVASAMPGATQPTISSFTSQAARDAQYAALVGKVEWLCKMTRDPDGDFISSEVKKFVVTTTSKVDLKSPVVLLLGAGAAALAWFLYKGKRR